MYFLFTDGLKSTSGGDSDAADAVSASPASGQLRAGVGPAGCGEAAVEHVVLRVRRAGVPARLRCRGRLLAVQAAPGAWDVIFLLMLATLMIPTTVLVVPQYVTVVDLPILHLNLVGTPEAIWLPSVANAFNIFLLKRFFDSIPHDYIDAARSTGLPGCDAPTGRSADLPADHRRGRDLRPGRRLEGLPLAAARRVRLHPTRESLNVGIWQASQHAAEPHHRRVRDGGDPDDRLLPDLPAQHHGRPHRGRYQGLIAGTVRTKRRKKAGLSCTKTDQADYPWPPRPRLPGGAAPRSTSSIFAASRTATVTGSAIWPRSGHLPYLAELAWTPSGSTLCTRRQCRCRLRHQRLPLYRSGFRHPGRRGRPDQRSPRLRNQDHH